jgi:hypothetical protein
MGRKTTLATLSKKQNVGTNFITCFAVSTVLTCVVCDCQVSVKSLKITKSVKLCI